MVERKDVEPPRARGRYLLVHNGQEMAAFRLPSWPVERSSLAHDPTSRVNYESIDRKLDSTLAAFLSASTRRNQLVSGFQLVKMRSTTLR